MRRLISTYVAPMLLLLVGVGIGWLLGSVAWGITAGTVVGLCASAIMAWRDHRLTNAIQRSLRGSAPHPLDPKLMSSSGVLGDVFRDAARLARQTRVRFQSTSEQLQQQALLLDRMSEGLMLMTSDGLVTYANVAASSLFGGRNPLNRSFIGVTRDHELNAALQTCFQTGMRQRHTFELAGEGRIVDADIVLLDESPQEALVMLREITEMNRLLNLRRDFVANVSHELRTPLSTMKILTETLMEIRADDEDAVQFLTKIDDEVDSMTALVRDLLDLTRLESGAVRLAVHHVDVGTLVDDVCNRMRPLAQRQGVVIHACVDSSAGSAAIDERRFHQALMNLISNAIAHTPRGGEVTVRADGERGQVTFEVADTGSGISAADLPRIWERFFKSDRARTGPGTGLGLAIVKHIVQAHNGSVSAESNLGSGSTFRITIPRGTAPATLHVATLEPGDGTYVPG